MAAARSVFAAAALEGEIYVCGGQGEDGEATASCEKFSPKLGRCVSTLSTLSTYLHLYIYTYLQSTGSFSKDFFSQGAVN